MNADLKLRLLVALVVSLPLGWRIGARSRERLAEWDADPAAARSATINRLKSMASGAAFAGSAFLCVSVVLLVELVMSFIPRS